MKATKQQLIEEVKKLEHKYEMLVWYARKSQQQTDTMEGVRIAAEQVCKDYPEETESLRSPLSGDWQHGFNSGMLAGTRFVLDALDAGIEEAHEIFPDLNL